jgi:hypothetical protein
MSPAPARAAGQRARATIAAHGMTTPSLTNGDAPPRQAQALVRIVTGRRKSAEDWPGKAGRWSGRISMARSYGSRVGEFTQSATHAGRVLGRVLAARSRPSISPSGRKPAAEPSTDEAIGSYSIGEFPFDFVRIECERRGRAGRYRKDGFFSANGRDPASRLPWVQRKRRPRPACMLK